MKEDCKSCIYRDKNRKSICFICEDQERFVRLTKLERYKRFLDKADERVEVVFDYILFVGLLSAAGLCIAKFWSLFT